MNNNLEINCDHCWHPHTGPIWMVIPEGNILVVCCKCGTTRLKCSKHVCSNNDLNDKNITDECTRRLKNLHKN